MIHPAVVIPIPNRKLGAVTRDTEHVVDKHLKLDEPFLSDSKSTQNCLIKVTDQNLISDNRADENVRSTKQDDIYGTSNILQPCPGS
jgi:hypothetical protein